MPPSARPPDLLRRFTPTPLVAELYVMGRVIRLETNSQAIVDQTRLATDGYGRGVSRRPDFRWRIVSEAGPDVKPSWPELTALSDEGLSFVEIGQCGFLAVDWEAREGVGFLAEDLARDKLGFRRPFLAMLFSLTSRAMRLIPFSAACVARGEDALLIFGTPNSGKTVSSYFATKLGLQFHADHIVFLEARRLGLRAWGEFWPAVFQQEAQHLLPELATDARPFHYQNQTYLYLEKPNPSYALRSVTPVCCIFLERHSADTSPLTPLGSAEFRGRLKQNCLFQGVERSDPEQETICNALANLPAHRLGAGNDPRRAAELFRSLLSHPEFLESKP